MAFGRRNRAIPAEWKLLFALARYGGLRIPSEALLLRWADIDWDHDRFTVHSPKTEHHEGKGERIVPIFPELHPYLLDAFENAAVGAEWCITRYRDPGVNLRTQLLKIIRRAGLKAWPKLWQNLRSTRQTELADSFPAHVASAWIGNSVPVAVKHYLQVTDDHFALAIEPEQVVQKAVQKPAETTGNEPQPIPAIVENSAEIAIPAAGQGSGDGRYWTRTSDLTGVIRAF